jgi:hypothetical protein
MPRTLRTRTLIRRVVIGESEPTDLVTQGDVSRSLGRPYAGLAPLPLWVCALYHNRTHRETNSIVIHTYTYNLPS